MEQQDNCTTEQQDKGTMGQLDWFSIVAYNWSVNGMVSYYDQILFQKSPVMEKHIARCKQTKKCNKAKICSIFQYVRILCLRFNNWKRASQWSNGNAFDPRCFLASAQIKVTWSTCLALKVLTAAAEKYFSEWVHKLLQGQRALLGAW